MKSHTITPEPTTTEMRYAALQLHDRYVSRSAVLRAWAITLMCFSYTYLGAAVVAVLCAKTSVALSIDLWRVGFILLMLHVSLRETSMFLRIHQNRQSNLASRTYQIYAYDQITLHQVRSDDRQQRTHIADNLLELVEIQRNLLYRNNLQRQH